MFFRFRPVLTILTALGVAALIALGNWQMERLAWKEALIAQTQAGLKAAPIDFDEAAARALAGEAMEYRPVRLRGVYAHELETRVFGSHEGQAGVFVFTPLVVSDDEAGRRRFVYVNRGFAPQAFGAPESREEGAVAGEVGIGGLFRVAERPRGFARLVLPKGPPADNLWLVRDPERFAAAAGIETVPWYIDSDGAENPHAWPKGGMTRLDFSNSHLEYALTWYGLAATLVGVFLAFSFRRRRQ